MAYSKEQLRKIFQSPFDREAWKAIVVDIFGANKVRRENELFTDPDDPEVGYYMGSIDTPDHFHIGLFYYKINKGSVVHKKVGLRNLVRRFINQNMGEFDAALVVYNSEPEWRLSFICDIKEESTAPKRFTFVFGESDSLYRTAIERFEKLQTEEATFENIKKAFSVDALSDDFFDEYRELYADFVQYITGKRYVKEGSKWVERVLSRPNHQFATTFEEDDKLVRDYIKKMFGRIVFLYFLQRKGWLNGNRNYMHDLYAGSDKKDNFLDGVLEPLFFEVLNTEKRLRSSAARALPGVDNIPYLNGGLFASDYIDDRTCVFPEKLFKELFDFLDSYNFTIDENDTDDAEIGIDPEMLGRIFENLLEDNKDKGAFYTPKEIVNYMCRESVIAYLNSSLPEIDEKGIRMLVEHLDASQLNEKEKLDIRRRLQSVKICDPAIGSGAFPMGLVNILSKLYVAMKTDTDTKTMKRHIMEQNIYGVDIEKGAVDIARLRFWLAMIVEEPEPIPLPNLHFKIMQGNSLLESYNGIDLSDLTKVNVSRDNLFDLDDTERTNLINALKKYYKSSDHDERDRLFNEIIQNVRRQLYTKQIVLPSGMDPSANTDFFLWHTWFTDVFEKGGFDIVIGNPPYLKEGKASKSIFEAVKSSPYYKGKMDLWYLFACHGIDILKSNGNLCFIATNNWVTSAGAEKLRKKVNTDARIIQLCDFRNYMIFKTASIQTMVMQFQKNSSTNEYTFDLRNLLGSKIEDVNKLLNKEKSDAVQYLMPSYNRIKMTGKFVTFSDSDLVLNKIASSPTVIYLRNEELTNGIHPHFDFVNKKLSERHSIPIGTGIFGLSERELNSLHLTNTETSFIKPYYCSSEFVHRYWTNFSTPIHIIYTNSEYKNPKSMDAYPNLKKHLDKFSDVITSDNKPYGLHRSRKEKFFKNDKIAVLRKCSDRPVFSFSNFDCYLSATFYIIQTERFNLKYGTALLNSKLIEFWLRNRGKMQGLNYQLDKEPLQQIPIAVPNNDIQTHIGEIVSEIIERKSNNKNASIHDLENQIDHIVYHLYNLTYDEVLIIDPETPISREEYENFRIEDVDVE